MNDEILITLVRDNPELYNLESKKYSDANHKAKVWLFIAKELNTTAATCKNRWNQLRHEWRKQKKKKYYQIGSSGQTIKAMALRFRNEFLEPFVRLRDTIGNLTNETAVDEDENLDENIANDEDSTRISDPNEVLTSATNSGPQEQLRATNKEAVRANMPNSSSGKIQRTRFRGTRNKDQDTASSALMKYLLNKQEAERSVLAASAPKHATDAFFAGILAKVKRFSPYYKNMVESKIFNFVQEIKLQQIMQGQQQDLHIASQQSTHQHQEISERYTSPVTSNSTTPFSGTPSPHTPQSAATYLETFSYDESSQI